MRSRYLFEINESKLESGDKLKDQIARVKEYLVKRYNIKYDRSNVNFGSVNDQFIRNKYSVRIDFINGTNTIK